MTKEEKIKAITELEKEQWKLLKKSLKIAKLKAPKRWQTSIVRAMKIFTLTMQAKQIQAQKKMIASQPTPNFPKGGIVSIKESGEEVILNKRSAPER